MSSGYNDDDRANPNRDEGDAAPAAAVAHLLDAVGPIARAAQQPHDYELGVPQDVLDVFVDREVVGEEQQVGEAQVGVNEAKALWSVAKFFKPLARLGHRAVEQPVAITVEAERVLPRSPEVACPMHRFGVPDLPYEALRPLPRFGVLMQPGGQLPQRLEPRQQVVIRGRLRAVKEFEHDGEPIGPALAMLRTRAATVFVAV